MSLARRGQHWGTFSRIWHLYDAKWQDPFQSSKMLQNYLMGLYKPIYHPLSDCGDHVVVINSKDIALRGDEWRKRVYFHHTTYHGGATWTLAWELHSKDPTLVIDIFYNSNHYYLYPDDSVTIQTIMKKAVYSDLPKNLQRRYTMQRLHIFPDDKVPEDMLKNIGNQIRQLRPVPVRLDHIPQEVRDNFPQIMSYPSDYILK